VKDGDAVTHLELAGAAGAGCEASVTEREGPPAIRAGEDIFED